MAKQHEEMIQYTECFVAFIDILGFGGLVKRSCEDPHILRVLTRALNVMAELPSGEKRSEMANKQWRVQTRAFSDTVVIFMPAESGNISQMLFMVRYLHDRILELELCMRGAVTIGKMYWNDGRSHNRNGRSFPVTLGPGLTEAYRLESNCAINPRILISDILCKYVTDNHVKCTPFGSYQSTSRLLTDFIRTDTDKLRFLDLLHPEITRNDTERIVRIDDGVGQFTIQWEHGGSNHANVMTAADTLINRWLDRKQCPEKIKAKYEWLKSYAQTVRAQTGAGGH